MYEKTFLALGESQFGKSSFISMISGRSIQCVNTEAETPCTNQIKAVPFTDALGIVQMNTNLCCLEFPGFNDDSPNISNKQTLDNIKLTLAETECHRLDALFIFQSAAESALRLAKLFSMVESLFGPAITRSCVIIATKSDILPKNLLLKRRQTIEDFAVTKNVPVVWWVNDSDEAVSSAKKQDQAADLKRTLVCVQAYDLTDMDEFEQRIQIRAQELMRLDHSNVETRQVEVPYEETVTYEIDEPYQVPVIRQQFTEDEIMNKARQLQSLPEHKVAYVENVKLVEKVKKYQTYCNQEKVPVKKSFFWIFKWEEIEDRPVERTREIYVDEERWEFQVKYKDQDLEVFAEPLRNQTICDYEQRIRKVQKTRVEKRIKTLTETVFRRDWKCYRSQAVKDLITANR